MGLLLPLVVLIGVVVLAVAGRMASPGPGPVTPRVAAPIIAAAAASAPVAAPSRRSDWPAAFRRVPIDWSTIYDERATWAADRRLAAATFPTYDTTPPWVRRLRGFSNYRADPYQR